MKVLGVCIIRSPNLPSFAGAIMYARLTGEKTREVYAALATSGKCEGGLIEYRETDDDCSITVHEAATVITVRQLYGGEKSIKVEGPETSRTTLLRPNGLVETYVQRRNPEGYGPITHQKPAMPPAVIAEAIDRMSKKVFSVVQAQLFEL